MGLNTIGMLIFLETHRRVFGNTFGRLPECLSRDAFDMRGYCIDAPDLMPAGSVVFSRFGPEPEDWVDVPSTVERESL